MFFSSFLLFSNDKINIYKDPSKLKSCSSPSHIIHKKCKNFIKFILLQ